MVDDGPARAGTGGVTLFWLPLGAGASVVRLSGRAFESVGAWWHHRPAVALFHSALVVDLEDHRYAVEVAPVPDADGTRRGVAVSGPVGLRVAGRLRLFRYEVRCWRDGSIPDLASEVGGPVRVSDRVDVAERVVDLTAEVPALTWGRDELGTGHMWNSNSVTAWLLARAGVDPARLRPPGAGRAPGWDAGVVAAGRGST